MVKERNIVMARTRKVYDVNCINKGGMCYATHTNCDWDGVKRYKKLARILGETVEYECVGVERTE